MKKTYRFFFSILLVLTLFKNIYSQNQCSTNNYYQTKLLYNPNLNDTMIQKELGYQYIMSTRSSANTYPLIYIPVVFHVIYDNNIASTYLSSSQIRDLLAELNRGFSSISGTTGLGVNCDIKFCLAVKDPFGNSSNGITYTQHNYGGIGLTDSDDQFIKNIENWSPIKYLNIWIVDLDDDSGSGYSSFPWDTDFGDGIVLDYLYAENSIIHEVGHWLGLYHTHEDQGNVCNTCLNNLPLIQGDKVSDTPPERSSSGACNTRYSCSCSNNVASNNSTVISNENYMGYGTCRSFFREGQNDRIHYYLEYIRSTFYDNSLLGGGLSHLPIECNTCNNEILDVGEQYVDCGGLCPPCIPSVSGNGGSSQENYFKINGKIKLNQEIINFCMGNFILSPYHNRWSPVVNGYTNWALPCNLADTPVNAYSCSTTAYPFPVPHPICNCEIHSLSLNVQECDNNKNPIGIDYQRWIRIQDDYGNIDLLANLPTGCSILEGKIYKIRIGEGGSTGFTAYIKIYAENLTISNSTINHDQFADYLTIENSSVPWSYLSKKFVAKTKIEILPETNLLNGVYYIDNFDCGSLDQFRSVTNNNSNSEGENYYVNSLKIEDKIITPIQLKEESGMNNNLTKFKMYPNPSKNELFIELESKEGEIITVGLYDVNSTLVKSLLKNNYIEKGQNTIRLNIDIANGVYFLRLDLNDETVTKKLIVIKE